MMQLGAESVFVGSGIFKSSDPETRARSIVQAVTHFRDKSVLLQVSKGLKEAMPGLDLRKLAPEERLADRGW